MAPRAACRVGQRTVLISVALLALGCGGDNEPPGGGSPPLTIATASLPSATVGQVYEGSLGATRNGSAVTATWTVSAGTLPAGLQVSGQAIAGTPTTAGSQNFTVSAAADGETVTKALTIVVSPRPTTTDPLVITAPAGNAALPIAIIGTPYTFRFTASGGTPPYRWTTTGTLPAGLQLSSDGVMTGTPTAGGTVDPLMVRVTAGTATADVSTRLVAQGSAEAIGLVLTRTQELRVAATSLAGAIDQRSTAAVVREQTDMLRRLAAEVERRMAALTPAERDQFGTQFIGSIPALTSLRDAFSAPSGSSARRASAIARVLSADCEASLHDLERIEKIGDALDALKDALPPAAVGTPLTSAVAIVVTAAAFGAQLKLGALEGARSFLAPNGLQLTATPADTYDDGGEVTVAARVQLSSMNDLDPSRFQKATIIGRVTLDDVTKWPGGADVKALAVEAAGLAARLGAGYLAAMGGAAEATLPFSEVSLDPLTTADVAPGSGAMGTLRTRPLSANDNTPIPVTLVGRTGSATFCRAATGAPPDAERGINGFRIRVGYLEVAKDVSLEVAERKSLPVVLKRGDGQTIAAADFQWQSTVITAGRVRIEGSTTQAPPLSLVGVAPGKTDLTIRATKGDGYREVTMRAITLGSVVANPRHIGLVRKTDRETRDLDAEVRDSRGQPVASGAIEWQSRNPDGLKVDRVNGTAQGLRDGRYYAIASAGDAKDSILVDVMGPLSGLWTISETWIYLGKRKATCGYSLQAYVFQRDNQLWSGQPAFNMATTCVFLANPLTDYFVFGTVNVNGDRMSITWHGCGSIDVPAVRGTVAESGQFNCAPGGFPDEFGTMSGTLTISPFNIDAVPNLARTGLPNVRRSSAVPRGP